MELILDGIVTFVCFVCVRSTVTKVHTAAATART